MNALPSRPLFAIGLTLLLLTCTWAYVDFVQRVRPPELIIQESFAKDTSVKIRAVRTFTCQPGFDAPALRITFRNQTIFESPDSVSLPPTQPVEFVLDQQLVLGQNALGISLNAGLDDSDPPSDSWDERDWQEDAKKDADEKTNATETYSDQFDDPVSGSPMAFRVTVSIGRTVLTDQSFWLPGPGEWTEEIVFDVVEETKP